ncbi:MAG: hypothetical protein GEU88_09620, partial [Solirubrobacterales bacterium]|nr:hypothetical protein [Solirubrobacterales bacterium]
TTLAAHADEELAATGSRSRNILRGGTDALTASERRVADLAAGGMSNPAIARELVVSPRTVETHLSRTYQKLDIAGRRQLAAALAGDSPEPEPGASG